MKDITEIVKYLETYIEKNYGREMQEDEIVYDRFGGNMDDAFHGGVECGEVIFAKHLLSLLEK